MINQNLAHYQNKKKGKDNPKILSFSGRIPKILISKEFLRVNAK